MKNKEQNQTRSNQIKLELNWNKFQRKVWGEKNKEKSGNSGYLAKFWMKPRQSKAELDWNWIGTSLKKTNKSKKQKSKNSAGFGPFLARSGPSSVDWAYGGL